MEQTGTYLAVFIGSKKSPRWVAWDAMSEAERRAKEREGMAAWQARVMRHQADIADSGCLGAARYLQSFAASESCYGLLTKSPLASTDFTLSEIWVSPGAAALRRHPLQPRSPTAQEPLVGRRLHAHAPKAQCPGRPIAIIWRLVFG